MYRLFRQQHLPVKLEDAFAFFEDATNLEIITPEFLNFRITSELPIEMCEGQLIDYRLRLFGVPISWTTKIVEYQPPFHFCDMQIRGPYNHWFHRHEFKQTNDGTLMTDVVDYQIPLGVLGKIARRMFVQKTLKRIFDYRCEQIHRVLG